MFSENDVINLLSTSGYTVELTKNKDMNLLDINSRNIFYVGYGVISSPRPNLPIEHDLYNLHGEDLVQSFDISMVCSREDIPDMFKAMYTALIGKNPIPAETDRSGFTLSESGPMGFSNDSIWWLSRWRIGFPTVFTLF